MSIHHQILGNPGQDNALFVTVDSGHSLHRFLFDCGEACLSSLAPVDVGGIAALFFSHFHMDHVAGFDSFVRANWNREELPVRIFGPPGTIDIIQHRLRGFIWNLSDDSVGDWIITEIDVAELRRVRLRSVDGFSAREELGSCPHQGPVFSDGGLEVRAVLLDHGTPSVGYVLREGDRTNVCERRLAELGLQPGPWIQQLKDVAQTDDGELIEVGGKPYRVGELRTLLLETKHGDSIAYLTDFHLAGPEEEDRLVRFLAGCQTIVCESNYRDAEAELAKRHHHMKSSEVGALAARVDPQRLILFHLSDRYSEEEWQEQLEEVRSRFPRCEFPRGWFSS
ncbi:MAG: MBL fold metallo-hydrolase [Verrucomicrobiales bacterium]